MCYASAHDVILLTWVVLIPRLWRLWLAATRPRRPWFPSTCGRYFSCTALRCPARLTEPWGFPITCLSRSTSSSTMPYWASSPVQGAAYIITKHSLDLKTEEDICV